MSEEEVGGAPATPAAEPESAVEQTQEQIRADPEPDADIADAGQARAPTFADRVRAESDELDGRLEKLRAFLASPALAELPPDEIDRLRAQERCMSGYSSVLRTRIAKDFK